MSDYNFNAIYTKIAGAVTAQYPSAYISSRYEPVQEQFPTIYIEPAGKSRTPNATEITYDDRQYRAIHEVQVFTNALNGAKAQADAIMAVIEEAYSDIFFRETMCNPVETGDKSIYRLVARFTKQICSGDTLPS